MVFSSHIFVFVFLPLLLILYYNPIIKSRGFKNTILLLASLFFYAWGEPYFVFVMLLSIFVNFIIAKKIGTTENKKFYICIDLIWNIGLFFVFKYLGFFITNLNFILPTKLPVPNIRLPIGISFFTFQILSYTIDVYRKNVKVQKDFFNLALYISLFPQLIAGPIVRYQTVEDEIQNRKENFSDFSDGVVKFIIGLGKKCLVANYCGVITDSIYGLVAKGVPLETADAWVGAASFMLQIYFDFSGYSDMAIGLGKMFGFHFEENFDHPYMARTVTDLWRRWHISLTTWFRDYVYFPLGGSRCSKPRHLFNLFTVWLLTGFWHGAEWTFILWGIYSFTFQLLEKQIAPFMAFAKNKFFCFLQKFSLHIYTLAVFLAGSVIFKSENMSQAWLFYKSMFTKTGASIFENYYLLNGGFFILVVACVCCVSWKDALGKYCKNSFLKYFIKYIFVFAVFALSILTIVKSTYNPFIYFNF